MFFLLTKNSAGATRALDTETEATRDVRNMHERNQKIHEQIMSGAALALM